MSTRVRWFVSAVVIVAGVAGLGCENKEKKDAERRDKKLERQDRRARERAAERDRVSDRDRPDPIISRDRDRASPSADRSRPGLEEVPTTATRVDEGAGPRLTYTPARDGTLYVYDADDDRVVVSTRVRQDERFVLDPDGNRATLDGRTVLGTGLVPRHRYRLYFDRGRAG